MFPGMTDFSHGTGPGFRARPAAELTDMDLRPDLYEGVITKRIGALVVDVVIISVLVLLGYAATFVMGFLTLGLAWLAFGLVFPAIALGYHMVSIGGPWSATPGMRLMGLEMFETTGGRPTWIVGLAHPLIFWITGTLTAFLVAFIALFDARGRTLQDMLTGVVVVNRLDG